MAKKDKTNTLLMFGGLALGAGAIAYYALSSGLLGFGPTVEAVPETPAATAPTTIPGVTDYPTLTETLNAPSPIPTYTPPITTPVPEPEPEPEPTPKCPTGWTGTYPSCVPPPPIYQCAAGWTGQYPNCIPPAAPVTPTCPTGWTGTYPSCVPPAPVYKCPTNWTGTYPNCTPPVIVPPVVTPPPPKPSTCVRNSSLCSSKYHGKCNTECRNSSSSACKGCRCACEGRSNLALAFAGSRYSDDGVNDRAYYVTAVGY